MKIKNFNTYDLVIVGFGVVGTTAALLAAKYKLRTAVIDLHCFDDLPIAKSARVDAEVIRIFEHLGIRKELTSLLRPLSGTQIVDASNRVLFQLSHAAIEEGAPMYGFYQPDLQRVLQKKLAQIGGKYIHFYEQHRAEATEKVANGITLHLHNLGSDDFFQIKTRFLLACNGQDSLIPAQFGLEYRYFGKIGYTLNVDTETKAPVDIPLFARTVCGTELPVTYVADAENHQRWEFQLSPEQVAEVNTPDRIRKLLEQHLHQPFEVHSTFIHRYESKMLNKWQSRRVFITGDAAHVMPPYLGLSLSTGIKDVYNLIWKLAMVADRTITGQALDYYQGERESDVLHLMRLNMAVKRLSTSGWLRWVRRLLPIIPKVVLKRTLHIETWVKYGLVGIVHPLRGRLVPHFSLCNLRGMKTTIEEALGDGFVFLAMGENPVDAVNPHELEYLAKLGIHFIKIVSQKQTFLPEARYTNLLYDVNGSFEKWCLQHRIKYVILRPDRILFDAAKNKKELQRLLRLLERKLPLRTMPEPEFRTIY